MKVLYDHQIFESQQIGGISRYVFELIKYFEKTQGIDCEVSIKYSDNLYLKEYSRYNSILPKPHHQDHFEKLIAHSNIIGKKYLLNLYKRLKISDDAINSHVENQLGTINKLKEGNFDIFHPTYYDNYFLDFIGEKTLVITVHDLIHQIFPEYGLYELKDKNQRLISRANRIIAVSENTKRDLIEIYDVDEEKVDVVYLANPLDKKHKKVGENFHKKIPEKYLLFVGGREGYKNFMFFIQMFSRLNPVSEDLYVVCTGAPFNEAEYYLFNKLNLKSNVVQLFVNDDELHFLYENAIALIFPSLYEGFGIPILEAFSCNCPVLVSDSSSLVEIGNDAVIKFLPKNTTSMLTALKTIIWNNKIRKDLIQKGILRLKTFSWMQTGQQTAEIYQKAFSSTNR